MTQNLIDLDLTVDSLGAIDGALAELEARFAGLLALDPDLRRQLTKMGDRSEAFCRQAVVVFAQNESVLPRKFDIAELQRDLDALEAIRPRLNRLARLHERVADTEMALGSDLMTNALEGYAVLKVAGRGEGLDNLRQMLSVRFARGRRGGAAAAAAEPDPA